MGISPVVDALPPGYKPTMPRPQGADRTADDIEPMEDNKPAIWNTQETPAHPYIMGVGWSEWVCLSADYADRRRRDNNPTNPTPNAIILAGSGTNSKETASMNGPQ